LPATVRRFLAARGAEGRLGYLLGTERQLRPLWTEVGLLPLLDRGRDTLHSAPLRVYDRDGVWMATLHAGADLSEENLLHDIRAALAACARLRGEEMTRAKKVRKARRAQAPPPKVQTRLPRELLFLAGLGVAGIVAAGLLLWQSGDGDDTFSGVPAADPGPVHVHGLGVNPADGALFIATHTGMYRVEEGERKAERVGGRYQDTMGFTIVGPNRFLGSGHPDLNEAREKNLPSLLGLIESTDSGESWNPISLLGEADFHVLRFAGKRVYGYDASNDRLLVSADRGRTWTELERPGPLIDLAIDPNDPRRIVATTEEGLFHSRDGGRSWSRVGEAVGLLAWPSRDRLYLVAGGGLMFTSNDGGRRLRHLGGVGGQPAALLAQSADELYVALHDGTIKRSTDGGANWAVRSTP
jgi:Sortilin, neurotensin receptor 3,